MRRDWSTIPGLVGSDKHDLAVELMRLVRLMGACRLPACPDMVVRRNTGWRRYLLWAVCFFAMHAPVLFAQRAITTEAAPTRYFAAHGTRAFLGGNDAEGVEAYVYPLQLFRGLQVSFRLGDSATALPGKSLLRSVTYTPLYVERRYEQEQFAVTERLSVTPGQPSGSIEYAVRSHDPVKIELSFVPVLDLMWPAGAGGQEIHWRPDLNAYVFDEPTHRFVGIIGSPGVSQHDPPNNTNAPTDSELRLHMELRPAVRSRLFFAATSQGARSAEEAYKLVNEKAESVGMEAQAREQERSGRSLHIVTPNEEVNEALAWAELALDQAWACNPDLGCGLVGGYGPSRGIARRPQYAWFFAGDGLVSLRAMLEAGDFERAREELLFLLRYQDKQSGMMWHELSQSAAYLRWKDDYPYQFAHVDITPVFLSGVAEYVRFTGDAGFVRDHWGELQASYGYVLSLLDSSDGLPRVPAGKAGHDEQDHPPQELALAMDCLLAARDYAFLAATAGHMPEDASARSIAKRIETEIVPRFWNGNADFWDSGIGADGGPIKTVRLPPPASLALLSQQQRAHVLDRVDGPAFQTPWGVRTVAADSRGFNPAAYASGSVWGTSTSEAALMLWQNGRAERAWLTWQKLLPWVSRDSGGHVHEAMSGERFEPQGESVPEQTWSSALMLSSFLDGVLGLRYDASGAVLSLSPRLPDGWQELKVERLRIGRADVDVSLTRQNGRLAIAARASGDAVRLSVQEARSPGDQTEHVTLNGRPCREDRAPGDGCSVLLSPSSSASPLRP